MHEHPIAMVKVIWASLFANNSSVVKGMKKIVLEIAVVLEIGIVLYKQLYEFQNLSQSKGKWFVYIGVFQKHQSMKDIAVIFSKNLCLFLSTSSAFNYYIFSFCSQHISLYIAKMLQSSLVENLNHVFGYNVVISMNLLKCFIQTKLLSCKYA